MVKKSRPRFPGPCVLVVLILLLTACRATPYVVPEALTFFAMDTVVDVRVNAISREAARKVLDAAETRFNAVAKSCDRFRGKGPQTLAGLNQHSGTPYEVNDDVLKPLSFALEKPHKEFDPTLAPLSDLWRAKEKENAVPTKGELQAALALCGRDKVKPDKEKKTVTLAQGSSLDLGGIAKGYAVDEVFSILRKHPGVHSGLINAGGNVRVVGKHPSGKPWTIGVQHPRRKDKLLGTVELPADKALATSGDYQRYYEVNGVRYHHILNPADGRPARNNISVTVLADTALQADYYSTLLFVLPWEKGLRAAQEAGVEALIITSANEKKSTAGWRKYFKES